MKSFFTKILSFVLAVAILLTTSSFTVDMHFCCNKLVDMSILGKAKVCKDKVQKKDSTSKQCSSIQEKDCCSNQTFVKEGNDTLKKANVSLDNENFTFLNIFYYSYVSLFQEPEEKIIPFDDYRPPLLSRDIQTLNETFLI